MPEFPHRYQGGFANNFDLVRLILATSVVLLHFDHLVNEPAVTALLSKTEFVSGQAVEAFFVVSGFVVFMSFDRTRNIGKYALSRFLRLYPAYLVAVLAAAFLPLLLSTCNGQSIFTSTWWRYLISNLAFLNFLQPDLPCLFEGNFDASVNGSLWTLKIEVMFYAIVPILHFLIRRFGGVPVLATAFIIGLAYSSMLLGLAEQTGARVYTVLAYQLPGQLSFFSVGIFLFLYYERIARHFGWLLPLSLVILFAPLPWLHPVALGFVIIGLAVGPKRHVNLSRVGDLSYGIYIFHFPIIQVFLQLGVFSNSRGALFASVILATFAAAFLSSRLVEQPATRLKKKITNRQRARSMAAESTAPQPRGSRPSPTRPSQD